MLCLSGFELYSRWVPLKHGNEIKLLGLLQKLRCQGKVYPINGSWAL